MGSDDDTAVVLGEIGWNMQDAFRVFQVRSVVLPLLFTVRPADHRLSSQISSVQLIAGGKQKLKIDREMVAWAALMTKHFKRLGLRPQLCEKHDDRKTKLRVRITKKKHFGVEFSNVVFVDMRDVVDGFLRVFESAQSEVERQKQSLVSVR